MSKKSFIVYVLAVVMFLGAGCSKKMVRKDAEVLPPPVEELADKDEPSIRHDDWQSNPELSTIYFEYDSSELLQEARTKLKENANFLKQNPNVNILVEGHCDERGTVEYNLGLGQRRSLAVREYYGKLGISVGRIGTISYGEELPVDSGHTEKAWAKNRRAETKIRAVKNVKNHVDEEQEY